MPRCLLSEALQEPLSCRLPGFSDTSKTGYAAVVYLVLETHDGVTVRFVASKSRVAPLRELTIPRLELLSALLLARLIDT